MSETVTIEVLVERFRVLRLDVERLIRCGDRSTCEQRDHVFFALDEFEDDIRSACEGEDDDDDVDDVPTGVDD